MLKGSLTLGLISFLMIARIHRGPVRFTVRAAVYLKASGYALREFLEAGRERVTNRWREYLERAWDDLYAGKG